MGMVPDYCQDVYNGNKSKHGYVLPYSNSDFSIYQLAIIPLDQLAM